jgi:hypothetical protein
MTDESGIVRRPYELGLIGLCVQGIFNAFSGYAGTASGSRITKVFIVT